jgi:dihydrofolate synthase/folylpolyglutamate synthase
MIKTFEEAQQFIYRHIDADPKKRFAGEFGLRRGAFLLNLIGNPQNDLKVVHVAGTSGKGSTAFYISNLLKAQGLKVSLTVSPHLVDIRERCQINNNLVSKEEFVGTLNEIIPAIDKMKQTEFESPSYFEILMAVFFRLSLKNKVDYTVVETGLGGTFDGTNTIDREDKVCVITQVGLDHTEILGDTLDKVAGQKAGIIQKGNFVISCKQAAVVEKIITSRVFEKNGDVDYIKENINIQNIKIENDRVAYDFKYKDIQFDRVVLNTPAIYQASNSGLALATLVYLSRMDGFSIDRDKTYKCLAEINFPGRMESYKIKGKKLIIDGAHNPQKMKSLVESLKKIGMVKSNYLVAFRAGKDYKGMLKYLMPFASNLIITSFKMSNMDLAHSSEKPEEVEKFLHAAGFHKVSAIKDSKQALQKLLDSENKNLVITGSLYLLSDLYPFIKKYSG